MEVRRVTGCSVAFWQQFSSLSSLAGHEPRDGETGSRCTPGLGSGVWRSCERRAKTPAAVLYNEKCTLKPPANANQTLDSAAELQTAAAEREGLGGQSAGLHWGSAGRGPRRKATVSARVWCGHSWGPNSDTDT